MRCMHHLRAARESGLLSTVQVQGGKNGVFDVGILLDYIYLYILLLRYIAIYLYIYIVIALFIYCVVCLLLYCMLEAWEYCFLYIYILFLFLTSTSIFLSFRHLVIIQPFYVHKEMVVPKSQNTKQFGRKFFGKPKCATFVEGIQEKFQPNKASPGVWYLTEPPYLCTVKSQMIERRQPLS